MNSERTSLKVLLKAEQRMARAEAEILAATEEIRNARLVVRSEIDGNHGVRVSRRQQQVLDLVRLGLTNKEIAAKLYIEERTIKFHVSSLLGKFKVEKRGSL